jgi:hypothetical protein
MRPHAPVCGVLHATHAGSHFFRTQTQFLCACACVDDFPQCLGEQPHVVELVYTSREHMHIFSQKFLAYIYILAYPRLPYKPLC